MRFFFLLFTAALAINLLQGAPLFAQNSQSIEQQLARAHQLEPIRDLELKKQSAMHFKEKFHLITDDIASLSQINLKRFETLVDDYREPLKYETQAEALSSQLDRELSLEHSTSTKNAIAILNSGSFYSVDELIRRKIRNIDSKYFGTNTNYSYDGAIGEQDVIFLALKKKDLSESGDWGHVTFFFDRQETMKIAYFSLFAFLVGVNLQPPVAGIEPAIEANTRPYLKQMIPIYRDFVFQGEQAYKKLLKLSAEEYLWQKDHFSKDFLTRSDSDYQKFDKAVDEFYHQNSTSFENKKPTIADLPDISFEAQTIFSILGLAEARQPRSYLEAQSIMSFALIMEDDSPFRAIFGAYRGLPMTEEGRPPLFTQSHWFWEFKVPEQLPLSYVSAISIPETESVPVVTDKSGLSPMKEISTVETQKAIERYAQNSHREFKKEILPAQSKDKPTMIIYTFLN